MPNLFLGDCLDVLKTLPENSIDSLVTDPPAGIAFMGKSWDSDKGGRDHWIAWMTEIMREALRVMKPGAHGLVWGLPRTVHWTMTALEDAGFEIRDTVTHLQGQGFPKSTSVSKQLEKKGDFEAAKQWEGFGTSLKPSVEFWVLIRRPLSEKTVASNVLRHGCGGLNIDASRIAGGFESGWSKSGSKSSPNLCMSGANTERAPKPDNAQGRFPANLVLDEEAAKLLDEQSGVLKSGKLASDCYQKERNNASILAGAGRYTHQGYKPDQGGASRFFMVFKKECGQEKIEAGDTSVGKKTENKSDSWNTDGFGSSATDLYLKNFTFTTKTKTASTMTFQIWNVCTKTSIGTCTIESASVIEPLTELSIESVSIVSNTEALITLKNGQLVLIKGTVSIVLAEHLNYGETKTESTTTNTIESTEPEIRSRFFYVAKASRADKNFGLDDMPLVEKRSAGGTTSSGKPTMEGRDRFGSLTQNHHPTVKSTKLMEYLITLITPPGGTVLDPFAGSGSTGVAALRSSFKFLGIEKEPEYFEIAKKRLEAMKVPA